MINIKKINIILFIIMVLSVSYGSIMAQKGKSITIHSENSQVIDATTDPATQYLNGDVKLFHAGTFMYCDSAILRGTQLQMRFNVVLMQNDTIKIFCDSLRYDGDSLVTYLFGNIILENGPSKKLYTTQLRYDVDNKIAYYNKNARLIDGTSTLISKAGKYDLKEKTAWFYRNVKVNGDDFELTTDSIRYNTDNQVATFLAPVQIASDSSNIFSKSGWFDLDDKIGQFIGNAQYLEGKTRAASDTIHYNSELDLVTLSSDTLLSEYISEKDTAYAKTIFYDKKNEIFRLQKNAVYNGEKNQVKGDVIFYDKKTEKFNVMGRSFVSDPPSLIEADTLDYNKSIKFGKADGKVVWRDTSAKTTVMADHVLYRGEENYMIASNDNGRPLFISEIENDTLFMRADTLRAFRVIKERIILPNKDAARKSQKNKAKTLGREDNTDEKIIEQAEIQTDTSVVNVDTSLAVSATDTIFTGIMDTIDYFVGDNDVRIFKTDMQAVCDSLLYNKRDSIFTLHDQPFVWSDSSQIAGDTIHILMKDKKVDKLTVTSGATILNSEDLVFFNQIRGRYLEALFEESKIYRMDVNGDAQIVYYMTDDAKAYIGVNTTEASNMTFLLSDNKITDIKNYGEPKSKVLPMKKTDHETIKVKGFIWNINKRPKGLDDL
jgi:lipopolysaccharide export system protein LptA